MLTIIVLTVGVAFNLTFNYNIYLFPVVIPNNLIIGNFTAFVTRELVKLRLKLSL